MKNKFENCGITLTDKMCEHFQIYYSELIKWNKKINLISKNDEVRIIERHFLESAALSLINEFNREAIVLDLGTGAGFPGIPLKIVSKNITLTLLESKRMKGLFLRSVVEKLGFTKINVVCKRAESFAKSAGCKNKFDMVVCRAVADLKQTFKWALPFLKVNGKIITIKGSNFLREIIDLKLVHPQLEITFSVLPLETKIGTQTRQIVIIHQNS
ncbi:MAG: 16S rRNA (guanine(527)-N(7))-methyltransferase RsmG [bacterium]